MDSRGDFAIIEHTGDQVFAGYFHPNTSAVVQTITPTPCRIVLCFIVLPRVAPRRPAVLEHIEMQLEGTALFAGIFRPNKCVVLHIDVPNPGPVAVSFWVLDDGVVPLSNRTLRRREIEVRPLEGPEAIAPVNNNNVASGSSSSSRKRHRPSDA